jgi:hypothetical protein
MAVSGRGLERARTYAGDRPDDRGFSGEVVSGSSKKTRHIKVSESI